MKKASAIRQKTKKKPKTTRSKNLFFEDKTASLFETEETRIPKPMGSSFEDITTEKEEELSEEGMEKLDPGLNDPDFDEDLEVFEEDSFSDIDEEDGAFDDPSLSLFDDESLDEEDDY